MIIKIVRRPRTKSLHTCRELLLIFFEYISMLKLPKIKPYLSKLEYSYAFGAYPVIDLFKFKADKVIKVLLHPDGKGSDGYDDVIALCKEFGVPFEEHARSIEKISHKGNTYVVGLFEKYELPLDNSKKHVVLDQIRNMGNLGTIIRTMVAFGYEDLALVGPCADIFDPKVVRSAMGSLFGIRFQKFTTISDYLSVHSDGRALYCLRLDASKEIRSVEFNPMHSMIMGNESKGLGEDYKDLGIGVYIKHSDEVDSLNLSIATGITLFAASASEE